MPPASEPELVDTAVLLALRELRVADEPDPAEDVLRIFVEVMPARLRGLHTALGAGDFGALRAIAHQVRGSSAAVGATAMHATAAELEALETFARADLLIARLEEQFTRTQSRLEALVRS